MENIRNSGRHSKHINSSTEKVEGVKEKRSSHAENNVRSVVCVCFLTMGLELDWTGGEGHFVAALNAKQHLWGQAVALAGPGE